MAFDDARARAARHLKNLLSAAAVGGVALTSSGAPAAQPGASAGPPAPQPPQPLTRPEPDMAVVCDPMPAPVDCSRAGVMAMREAISPNAQWQADGRLLFSLAATMFGRGVGFAAPRVQGAKMEMPTSSPGSFSAYLTPDKDARAIDVTAQLDCAGRARWLPLRIDLTGPRQPGAQVTIATLPDCVTPWLQSDVDQQLVVRPAWGEPGNVEISVEAREQGIGFKGAAKVAGARIVEEKIQGRLWRAKLELNPKVTAVVVTVPVACDGRPKPLDYKLGINGDRTPGKPVPGRAEVTTLEASPALSPK